MKEAIASVALFVVWLYVFIGGSLAVAKWMEATWPVVVWGLGTGMALWVLMDVVKARLRR